MMCVFLNLAKLSEGGNIYFHNLYKTKTNPANRFRDGVHVLFGF